MRFAILSDIHANVIALNEVLLVLKNEKINNLFITGDFVGYYYQPKAVLDVLKNYNIYCVGGNHEKMLIEAMHTSKRRQDILEKYGHGIEFALEKLEDRDIDFLINLPDKLTAEVDGIKILLCHGSPWDLNYYLYPDAGEDIIKKFSEYDFDFIFFGHTHYPTRFTLEGKQVINSGSVGQSRVKGGIANFGVLDTKTKIYEQFGVSYNISSLLNEIDLYDPGIAYLKNILVRNNEGGLNLFAND